MRQAEPFAVRFAGVCEACPRVLEEPARLPAAASGARRRMSVLSKNRPDTHKTRRPARTSVGRRSRGRFGAAGGHRLPWLGEW